VSTLDDWLLHRRGFNFVLRLLLLNIIDFLQYLIFLLLLDLLAPLLKYIPKEVHGIFVDILTVVPCLMLILHLSRQIVLTLLSLCKELIKLTYSIHSV
jgi:hypothetical protein